MAAATVQKMVLELEARGFGGTRSELEQLLTQFDKAGDKAERGANKVENLTNKLDAQGRAVKVLTQLQKGLDAQNQKGIATTEAQMRALSQAEANVRRTAVNLSATGERGLGRYDWINLSRQFQDVVVSIAGGQRPLTVMLQQGSQISDVFGAATGGPLAALKDFGKAIGTYLINPVSLIAGVVGTAAYAMLQWQEEQTALVTTLNGVGKAAGLTADQITRIADASGRTSGLSSSAARAYAGQFAGAGVSGADIGGGVNLINPFAKRLGVEQGAAASDLANAIASPAKGAEDLAKKFGLLNYAEIDQIRALEAVGNKAAASALLIDTLSTKIEAMKDPTSGLSSVLEQAKNGLSNFITKVGDELAGPKSYADSIGKIAQATDAAKQKISDENASILKKVSDQYSTEATTLKAKQEQLAAAEKALNDPRAMTMLWENATRAADAVEKLQNQVAAFRDAATVTTERAKTAAALVNEDSLARKAQLQGEQAYRDEMRQSGDAALAAAKQAALFTEAMANVSKAIDDANKAAANQLELAGKSPVEQQMLRLEQQSRDAAEKGIFSQKAFSDQVKAVTQQYQHDVFGGPTQNAALQTRMLGVQAGDIGKSTYAKAYDTAYMEKVNQLEKDNIDLTPQAITLANRYAEAQANLAKMSEDVAKQQQLVNTVISEISSNVASLGSSLVKAFTSGEKAGKSMKAALDQILSSLLNMTLNKGITSLLEKLLSGAGGVGGIQNMLAPAAGVVGGAGGLSVPTFGSGGILGSIASIFGLAEGGVMTSSGLVPLNRYAGGGVANGPQMALFGEGRKPEAYVPLNDGRTIPVTMNKQQGGDKISIHNYAGADIQTQRMSDGELMIVVNKMVDQKMKAQVPGIMANSQRRSQ